MVKDIEDMPGDQRYGCKTMPIVWGIHVAKLFAGTWLAVITSSLLIVFVYVLQFRWWVIAVYCLAFVIIPLLVVMRNLWNTEKVKRKSSVILKNDVSNPQKLTSIGIKRLMERALWTQNLRIKDDPSSKRYAFPVDHGFRRFYKTRCEIGGMKPANIELLLGHFLGISSSYYKPTEEELLKDYLDHVEHLLINNEGKFRTELQSLQKENNELIISSLNERVAIDDDAMSLLSDRIIAITNELESIKNQLKHTK